jgi:ATP-dependent Lon protease
MTDKPSKPQKTNADPIELPVLPLRDVVVFPHMVIPLFVGREKSVRALESAMADNKKILLVAQRSPDVDEPAVADLYTIGTIASVLQLLKLPDGTIKVLVEGTDRAEIAAFGERDGLMVAHARVLDAAYTRSEREVEVIGRQLVSLFEQLVKLSRKIPPELMATLAGIEDPSRLADTIAAHIAVRVAEKQRVLETVDHEHSQEVQLGLVDSEIDVQIN